MGEKSVYPQQPSLTQDQNLAQAIQDIRRWHGERAITTGSQYAKQKAKAEVLPTGLDGLDSVIDGFPLGQLSRLTGQLTSGLTSLVYSTIKQIQQMHQQVLYLDGNKAFWAEGAAGYGVDLSSLYVASLPNIHWMLEVAHEVISLSNIGLVVLDVPSKLPAHARSSLKRLVRAVRRSKTVVLWVQALAPGEKVTAPINHVMSVVAHLQAVPEPPQDHFATQIRIEKHPSVPVGTNIRLSIPTQGESNP